MEKPVSVISIDAAALLTGTSKRTLWRRLSTGKLQRHSTDERGRVMLALDDVAGQSCIELAETADGYALLHDADRGNSQAQNDLALLFLEQERPDIAAQWFLLAAQQQHADAMHYLSTLYEQGCGVECCENTALLWRAKAANLGHLIARAQLASMVEPAEAAQ